LTDFELRTTAIDILIKNLGIIEAERFITLILKEPFDYTKWQTDLYSDMSVDELFIAASNLKDNSTT